MQFASSKKKLPWYLRLLRRMATASPPRVITGRGGDARPYLTRYFIFRHSVQTEGMEGVDSARPYEWRSGNIESCGRCDGAGRYMAQHGWDDNYDAVDCEVCGGHGVVSKYVETKAKPRWGLYLHCFHRSDDDGALHNHPWRWAVSLVLKGGYSEERRVGDMVVRRRVEPWTINFLTHDTFHRVDLVRGDAWTLFLVGPVVQSWGFWDRDTKKYTPWREFLGEDAPTPSAGGQREDRPSVSYENDE